MMVEHPAKYTDNLLPLFSQLLLGYSRCLDPFAGTSKLRGILTTAHIVTNELEPEWAALGASNVGNALRLPYADNAFDAVCTSPTYGNRMADHHTARDGSRRNTYRHTLGRPLHPENSGQLQWGDQYRQFHRLAWAECLRVLQIEGRFILNISDHIRAGKRVPVSVWHRDTLVGMGCRLEEVYQVETPRNGFGANGALRVEHENVFVFEYVAG